MFRLQRIRSSVRNIRFLSSKVIVNSKYSVDGLKNGVVSTNLSFPHFIMQSFNNADIKDEVAILCGASNKSLTYSETYQNCYSFAENLRTKYNVNKDSCVAIYSPNALHYFTVFNGIALTQGRSTTINPLYTVEEVEFQLKSTNAKVLVAHPFNMDKAIEAANNLNIPVISFGDVEDKNNENLVALQTLLDIPLDNIDKDNFKSDASMDDIITIPFSSGTTGNPKGVMLTHGNLISNLLQSIPQEGAKLAKDPVTGERGSLMCPLPFFHIYGMIAGMCLPLYQGAKLVFMPAFDLVRFLELLQDEKIQRAHLVPPIILALCKQPIVANYDLSNLKTIMSAAAPLSADVQLQTAEKLNVLVKQGWGMTELSPIGTIVPDPKPDEDIFTFLAKNKGSAGYLVPNTEGKIVCTETGKDLEYHQEGELMIRGPQVMKGYYNNEEATNNTIRSDGWMHTGDVGYFDNDGRLFITDRSKELIKYKGFQVAPAELEGLLGAIEGVLDVIVIPVLDDEAGELPRAYVVKAEGSEHTEESLLEIIHKKVAPHKKLRGGIIFVESVPKSASGKLLRRLQIQMDRGEI